MTAPNQPIDTNSALGDALRRIRILEALTPAQDCYAKLAEAVSVAGDYSFGVTDIDQSYEHLVVEVMAGCLVASETPTAPADLLVSINHEYTYAPQQVYADAVDPTVPVATRADDNETQVTLEGVLSYFDLNVGNGPGYLSRLTFHFPFYTVSELDDGFASVGGWFQGVAFGPLPYGSITREGGAHNVGGLITDPGDNSPPLGGPITEFTLQGSHRPYNTFTGPWSIATAYSAGDAVSYSGGFYICTTANTGQAPSPPLGGTYWETFYRTFVPGSKISVYGIC